MHEGEKALLMMQTICTSPRSVERLMLHQKGDPSRRRPLVSRIGRFSIHKRIGEGTFGTVYQASDQDGSAVAIKRIKARYAGDRLLREQFRIEALALKMAPYPSAVRLIESVQEAERPFLVMEHLDATPLHRMDSLSWRLRHKLTALSQACQGVASLHQAGIIHRDLHPGHILIDNSDNSVRVIDFGLARLDSHPDIYVGLSSPIGTPPFMAPELTRPGTSGDARSDIFSLSSSIYAVLSGVRPFIALDLKSYVHLLRNVEPLPIEARVPGIPKMLADLIMRAMSKDPSRRPKSALELKDEIDSALSHLSGLGWDF